MLIARTQMTPLCWWPVIWAPVFEPVVRQQLPSHPPSLNVSTSRWRGMEWGETTRWLESLYREALQQHLAGGGEEALREAYEAGRIALSQTWACLTWRRFIIAHWQKSWLRHNQRKGRRNLALPQNSSRKASLLTRWLIGVIAMRL